MDGEYFEMKHSKREIELFVHTLASLISIGLHFEEIIKFADKEKWNVTRKEITQFVKMAREYIAKKAILVRPEILGECIVRLDDLYKRSMAINDFKTCLAIQREKHRLLQLDGSGEGDGNDLFFGDK